MIETIFTLAGFSPVMLPTFCQYVIAHASNIFCFHVWPTSWEEKKKNDVGCATSEFLARTYLESMN